MVIDIQYGLIMNTYQIDLQAQEIIILMYKLIK